MKQNKLTTVQRGIYFCFGTIAGVVLWLLTFMVLLILN